MTPASRLPVVPGDRVLDLCAAPGGKATELGAKLQGQGCLFANDISNSRAKALLKNLEQKGCLRLRYGLFVTVAADYAPYPASSLFAMLQELVGEGKEREGFLFDTAVINRGMAELTKAGRSILDERG